MSSPRFEPVSIPGNPWMERVTNAVMPGLVARGWARPMTPEVRLGGAVVHFDAAATDELHDGIIKPVEALGFALSLQESHHPSHLFSCNVAPRNLALRGVPREVSDSIVAIGRLVRKPWGSTPPTDPAFMQVNHYTAQPGRAVVGPVHRDVVPLALILTTGDGAIQFDNEPAKADEGTFVRRRHFEGRLVTGGVQTLPTPSRSITLVQGQRFFHRGLAVEGSEKTSIVIAQ